MKRVLFLFTAIFFLALTLSVKAQEPANNYIAGLIQAVEEAEKTRPFKAQGTDSFFNEPYLLNESVPDMPSFSPEWCRHAGISNIHFGSGITGGDVLYSAVFLATVQKTTEAKRSGVLPTPHSDEAPFCPELLVDGNFDPYGFRPLLYVMPPQSLSEVKDLLLRHGRYMRDTWGVSGKRENEKPYNCPIYDFNVTQNYGQELWDLMSTGLVLQPEPTNTPNPKRTPTSTLTAVAKTTGTITPVATATMTRTPTVTPKPTPPSTGNWFGWFVIAGFIIAGLVLAMNGYMAIENNRNNDAKEVSGMIRLGLSGFIILVPILTKLGVMQKIVDILKRVVGGVGG